MTRLAGSITVVYSFENCCKKEHFAEVFVLKAVEITTQIITTMLKTCFATMVLVLITTDLATAQNSTRYAKPTPKARFEIDIQSIREIRSPTFSGEDVYRNYITRWETGSSQIHQVRCSSWEQRVASIRSNDSIWQLYGGWKPTAESWKLIPMGPTPANASATLVCNTVL